MRCTVVVAGLLASLCVCASAAANETGTIKCSQETKEVSLYTSLRADQVAAQLHCGDEVEVIGRERGFVRIRTSQGVEGYIVSSALLKAAQVTSDPVAGTVEAANADPFVPADYTTMNAHCSTYFSAYGVSPDQLKWITNNARRRYPGVCPAATPGMVDYVVIFTHDVDFYPSAMPQPIYRDGKGFSDWTPLTTEDTALVPASRLDRARHEYVWVFHVTRGSFNPDTFSSRSRAQFAKIESRASGRTVEDAFRFIASGNPRSAATSLGQ